MRLSDETFARLSPAAQERVVRAEERAEADAGLRQARLDRIAATLLASGVPATRIRKAGGRV